MWPSVLIIAIRDACPRRGPLKTLSHKQRLLLPREREGFLACSRNASKHQRTWPEAQGGRNCPSKVQWQEVAPEHDTCLICSSGHLALSNHDVRLCPHGSWGRSVPNLWNLGTEGLGYLLSAPARHLHLLHVATDSVQLPGSCPPAHPSPSLMHLIAPGSGGSTTLSDHGVSLPDNSTIIF